MNFNLEYNPETNVLYTNDSSPVDIEQFLETEINKINLSLNDDVFSYVNLGNNTYQILSKYPYALDRKYHVNSVGGFLVKCAGSREERQLNNPINNQSSFIKERLAHDFSLPKFNTTSASIPIAAPISLPQQWMPLNSILNNSNDSNKQMGYKPSLQTMQDPNFAAPSSRHIDVSTLLSLGYPASDVVRVVSSGSQAAQTLITMHRLFSFLYRNLLFKTHDLINLVLNYDKQQINLLVKYSDLLDLSCFKSNDIIHMLNYRNAELNIKAALDHQFLQNYGVTPQEISRVASHSSGARNLGALAKAIQTLYKNKIFSLAQLICMADAPYGGQTLNILVDNIQIFISELGFDPEQLTRIGERAADDNLELILKYKQLIKNYPELRNNITQYLAKGVGVRANNRKNVDVALAEFERKYGSAHKQISDLFEEIIKSSNSDSSRAAKRAVPTKATYIKERYSTNLFLPKSNMTSEHIPAPLPQQPIQQSILLNSINNNSNYNNNQMGHDQLPNKEDIRGVHKRKMDDQIQTLKRTKIGETLRDEGHEEELRSLCYADDETKSVLCLGVQEETNEIDFNLGQLNDDAILSLYSTLLDDPLTVTANETNLLGVSNSGSVTKFTKHSDDEKVVTDQITNPSKYT